LKATEAGWPILSGFIGKGGLPLQLSFSRHLPQRSRAPF
jgi:hypothetical protein